jgi:hypothetical protein
MQTDRYGEVNRNFLHLLVAKLHKNGTERLSQLEEVIMCLEGYVYGEG